MLLLALTPLVLPSCDSVPTADADTTPTGTAKVLTNLLAEDTIDYTPTAQFLPIAQIVFETTNNAPYDDINLVYSKTKTHEFEMRGIFPDAFQTFQNVILTLLGTEGALPGDAGAIDDPLRQILFKPGQSTPSFSNLEIQNMTAQIAAVSEGFVLVHPTERYMFIVDELIIDHVSNSNNADLNRGRMSGEYKISARGWQVRFRRPTSSELADTGGIRLITSEHWIPFVSQQSASRVFIEGFDNGTYELQLANSAGGVANPTL